MHARIMARSVAVSGLDQTPPSPPATLHHDLGAVSVAISKCRDHGAHAQPMSALRSSDTTCQGVSIEPRRAADAGAKQIQRSVIVDITTHQPASNQSFSTKGRIGRRDFPEDTFAIIREKLG